ncbi:MULTISPECIES: hypothetical protein [unclassified Curtobacterium]|uniref:hypothetical protein n=1 Tax=unclassified Curtobacterium TaxID=257496 RepID=UPI000DA99CCE|nr:MULTISPECIES: hypothetical protein [unclassified Curtobacterium]PZE65502.1 hypothetical protein DEJ12_15275 [Curtobacterium sp. MCLR17_059]PZF51163.1 hypothetical protein DEJ10_10150 [Curtobacterium sp. MCLR17_057]
MTPPKYPRPFAWFMVIAASLLLALGLLNLIINTTRPGSWLLLMVLMPWPLYAGLKSLRLSPTSTWSSPL